MKTLFNLRLPTLTKIDEVNLFRLMANIFNSGTTMSTFVDEVHGHKGFVDYYSKYLGKTKKIEIADLLIITCNRRTNEIRLCFVQAKYRRGSYRRFLTFGANLYQWELLKDKPNIIDTYNKGFPVNILNFSTYESITSFGIFYHDSNGQIEFLFTLPKHIKNRNINKYQTMDFFAGCHCPNINCTKGKMKLETISTCSMDMFASEVLACRIGAPIDTHIRPFVGNLLNSMRKKEKGKNELINEFIDRLDYNNDVQQCFDYHPNSILVMTDGSKTNENFG
jgi:hypothetical protein